MPHHAPLNASVPMYERLWLRAHSIGKVRPFLSRLPRLAYDQTPLPLTSPDLPVLKPNTRVTGVSRQTGVGVHQTEP